MLFSGETISLSSENSNLIASLSGEIDHHTASLVKKAIDARLYSERPKKLILDLSGVGFMDSSGLGLILGRYQLSKELGCVLVLRDPAVGVMKILKLAGCEKLIDFEYTKRSV